MSGVAVEDLAENSGDEIEKKISRTQCFQGQKRRERWLPTCAPPPGLACRHAPGGGFLFFAAGMQLGSENEARAARKRGPQTQEQLPWVWDPPASMHWVSEVV